MSFLNKVFGKSKTANKVESLPEAIQKMKQTEDMLLKKQDLLEAKVKYEVRIAKSNAIKNKKVALEALRRKKRYQLQLQQVDGALTTLESQRDTLENAHTNTVVLSSLKKSSEAIKVAQKYLNVDEISEMMDDLLDQRELTEDVTNAISNPVASREKDEDEDELERELQELENETVEKPKEVTFKSKLPAVPQEDISETKSPMKKNVRAKKEQELTF